MPSIESAESHAEADQLRSELPSVARSSDLCFSSDPADQFEQEFRNVQRAGGFYAAMLLPLLVAMGWNYHMRSDVVETGFWTAGSLYTIIAIGATIWRREWWSLVRLPSSGSKRWLLAVGLTPIATIGFAELLYRWSQNIGLPVRDIMAGFGDDGYPVWLLMLSVIVLAPVFEEVAFRGVLMAQLQRVMSSTHAIWVAALLFGVLHFSVLSMVVFTVPLGAVAGYLTRETKSLLPAIALHSAHNAGILLLSLLSFSR